ncbi:MAG: hypothetical protein DRO67_09205, partial [Candidatus Asgardarchaeum californiense]
GIIMQVLPKISPDKKFKQFCNSLRCPLCGSQLDGNIHPKKASLYCCSNNVEYQVDWLVGQDEPEREWIRYYYDDYEYRISCSKNQSVIYRVCIDVHPSFRSKYLEEVLNIPAKLSFFRKKMAKKDFIQKLKLYNVFS